MRILETKLYQFDELSDQAQQKAIEAIRESESYLDYGWHDYIIEDWTTILEIIGFYNIKIEFSGFCSQGSGASFTADYCYKKGALKQIKKGYPTETTLHNITAAFQDEQKENFYQLEFSLYRSNYRYSHEFTVNIENLNRGDGKEISNFQSVENQLLELSRYLMQEIYSDLREEYYYLIDDEAIIDYAEGSGIEFSENGKLN